MKSIQDAIEYFTETVRQRGVALSPHFEQTTFDSIHIRFQQWESAWKAEGLTQDDPLFWDYDGFLQYWQMRVQGNQLQGLAGMAEIASRQLPPKAESELIELMELYFIPVYFQFRYLTELFKQHPKPNRAVVLESVIRFPTYILNPFERAGKEQSSYMLNILQSVGGSMNFHAPPVFSKTSAIRHLLRSGVLIFDMIPFPVSGNVWNASPWLDVQWEDEVIQSWGKPDDTRDFLFATFLGTLNQGGGAHREWYIAVLHKKIFDVIMRHRMVPKSSEPFMGMAMVSKSGHLTPDAQAIRDVFEGKPRRNEFNAGLNRAEVQIPSRMIHFQYTDAMTETQITGYIHLRESLYQTETIRLVMHEEIKCDDDGIEVNINALDALKFGKMGAKNLFVGINPKHTLFMKPTDILVEWNFLKDTVRNYSDEERIECVKRILKGNVSRFNRPVMLSEYLADDAFMTHLEQVVGEVVTRVMPYEKALGLVEQALMKTLPEVRRNAAVNLTKAINGIRMGHEAVRSLMQEERVPDPGMLFFYDLNTMASKRFEWFHELIIRLRLHFLQPNTDSSLQRIKVMATLQEALTPGSPEMYLWIHNPKDFYFQKDSLYPDIVVMRRFGIKTQYYTTLDKIDSNAFLRPGLQVAGLLEAISTPIPQTQKIVVPEEKELVTISSSYHTNMQKQIDDFYQTLNQVLQKFPKRRLVDFSPGMDLPAQGVYFFFEPGEYLPDGKTPRVVRIGTHAVQMGSEATLADRMKQHWGGSKAGNGRHRMSVHRELIGFALRNKLGLDYPYWGDRKYKSEKAVLEAEKDLELRVSECIRNFEFTVLEIPGDAHKENDRAFVERNAIALLSNYGKELGDRASSRDWLGRHSGDDDVLQSGLWNRQGVFGIVDADFQERFQQLAQAMPDYTKPGVKSAAKAITPRVMKPVAQTGTLKSVGNNDAVVTVYHTSDDALAANPAAKHSTFPISVLEVRRAQKYPNELLSVKKTGTTRTYFIRIDQAPKGLVERVS